MPNNPTKPAMRHNVAGLKADESVLAAFPDLAALPAFAAHGEGENDCYARFAVLYCAPDSPLRELPLDDKKRECFKLAGITLGDSRRPSIERWQDAGVVAMAKDYVRQNNSLKYALLFYGSEAAWQTLEKLAVPIEGDPLGDMASAEEYQAAKGKGEMDEAKVQTAYKTRRDNLDAMFLQVPKLEALRNELFMDDEELGAAALLQTQQNTPTAEKRAEGRSFIPAKAK